MKVLIISFCDAELNTRLASALSEQDNIEVCLMLPDYQVAAYKKRLSSKVNYQPFELARLRDPVGNIRSMRQLVKAINHYNPDIIHYQYAHLWFSLTLWFLRKYPLVISVHDPRDHIGDDVSKKTPQAVKDFGYRLADRIIAHNGKMKPIISDVLNYPAEQIDVIPLMAYGDPTQQPKTKKKGQYVLFFGRIWEYKGLEYLIQAEPLIRATIPEIKIVIAGEGENFERYRAMMDSPEQFIVHNRYIDADDEKAQLFSQASVVVLPYIEATQSAIISLAYNFAKPVIATAVGGLVEQVDDGITGYLIPPRDPQALADKVVAILKDEDLNNTLGQNGKMKLENEWSTTAIVQKTIETYKRAINHG